MNPFTPVWIGLTAAVLVTEFTAIRVRRNHPGGTLSSTIWRLTAGKTWRRLVLASGLLTLTAHLVLHIP